MTLAEPLARYDPNIACANLVASDNEQIVESFFQHLREKDIDG